MANVTTQEILAIQRMMGARSGGIDPFPIRATTATIGEIVEALPADLPINAALRPEERRGTE
jgi:hypothetical protein